MLNPPMEYGAVYVHTARNTHLNKILMAVRWDIHYRLSYQDIVAIQPFSGHLNDDYQQHNLVIMQNIETVGILSFFDTHYASILRESGCVVAEAAFSKNEVSHEIRLSHVHWSLGNVAYIKFW